MSGQTFTYRLYAICRQQDKLRATLDVCREPYQAALERRRDRWSFHRNHLHYVEPAQQLRDLEAVQ